MGSTSRNLLMGSPNDFKGLETFKNKKKGAWDNIYYLIFSLILFSQTWEFDKSSQ